MLETDLVHNLNASFWNYLSQALITIILISSYPEGRQYSETLASYHHPMLLGAFMSLLYVRMHALAVSLVFWSSQVFASPSDHLGYRGNILIFLHSTSKGYQSFESQLVAKWGKWFAVLLSRWSSKVASGILQKSVELHAPSSCSHPGVPQAALLAHGIILVSSCPNSKSGNHPGVILWTHVQKK